MNYNIDCHGSLCSLQNLQQTPSKPKKRIPDDRPPQKDYKDMPTEVANDMVVGKGLLNATEFSLTFLCGGMCKDRSVRAKLRQQVEKMKTAEDFVKFGRRVNTLIKLRRKQYKEKSCPTNQELRSVRLYVRSSANQDEAPLNDMVLGSKGKVLNGVINGTPFPEIHHGSLSYNVTKHPLFTRFVKPALLLFLEGFVLDHPETAARTKLPLANDLQNFFTPEFYENLMSSR